MRTWFFVILALLLGIPGISTAQKKKGKQPFLQRVYHNTTARYNGYYNAKLRLNSALHNVRQTHRDNYEELLDLYPYYHSPQLQSVSPDLDEVIRKASHVTQKHGRSKWADDCYLLIARSYFLKNDYSNARDVLLYISAEHKPVAPKKGKKKKNSSGKTVEDGEKKLLDRLGLKHKPVYYEAILWLIHSTLEQGEHEKAQIILDLMRSDKKFPEKMKGDLELLQAHINLSQNDLPGSVQALTAALPVIPREKTRARCTFLLAQLLQKTGRRQEAAERFAEVLKLNPPYEMEFYAKLNMARAYESGGELSIRSLQKELLLLAKDDKNLEYLDQIYYILAGLSLQENNNEDAARYLKLSITASTSNVRQKANSYQALARLYFGERAYRQAKLYYDSTLLILASSDTAYNEIARRQEVLSRLVGHLDTVEEQDSLRRLASMEPATLRKMIEKIIDDRREEMEKKKKAAEETSLVTTEVTEEGGTKPPGGGWYFDNPAAKSIGYNEFLTKWGRRPLEDNWRRKDKSSGTDESPEEEGNGAGQEIDESALLDPEHYYKNIPLTPEMAAESDRKITEALYAAAVLFKEDLHDPESAIRYFEELNRRYDTNRYVLQSYYYLYLLHHRLNNRERADHYRSLILSRYPGSPFAKVLENPAYLQEAGTANRQLLDYYEATYEAYRKGNDSEALDRCLQADSLYPGNSLQPKFELIKAYAYARTGNLQACRLSLEKIIARYPGDPVRPEADKLLSLLNRNTAELTTTAVSEATLYTYMPEELHYFVLAYPDGAGEHAGLDATFSDFNTKYFSLESLSVTSIMLDNRIHLLLVKQFPDAAGGVNYFTRAASESGPVPGLDPGVFQSFVISGSNLKILAKTRDTEPYLAFFRQHYPL